MDRGTDRPSYRDVTMHNKVLAILQWIKVVRKLTRQCFADLKAPVPLSNWIGDYVRHRIAITKDDNEAAGATSAYSEKCIQKSKPIKVFRQF